MKLKITYVANGKRGNPLMLCVHGFPECWYSWRFQLKEFSSKYWVVAINLPGYADSDKPSELANYTAERLIDNLAEVVEALGYEKGTVVAHDWGGALVWSFASLYSTMCDKVVIMNAPHFSAMKKMFRTLKQYRKSWYMFFFQLPWLPEMLVGCGNFHMFNECFRGEESGVKNLENMTEADVDVYKHALHSWEARKCAFNYYRANIGNVSPQFIERLKKSSISCPLLLIWGTEDTALSLELAALSAKVSNLVSVEYVAGASHWVQQDNPEEVNKYMWKFLN
ncbi:ceeh-1 [Bugula neritina]|uniref:Ceeh-1 n=1 Tax=Bugula neritina TaxID=10212 RepID=A0A7J7IT72_BUGNE|nr:ceeh-1 [Bugula neritina]